MKNRLTGFLIFSVCALLLQNCAYNTREEAPGPEVNCDSVNYTYTADIQPILAEQCTGCHKIDGIKPYPDLKDINKIRSYVNGNKSTFISSIRYEGNYPMPDGGPAMPDADQKKIEAWICQGMK